MLLGVGESCALSVAAGLLRVDFVVGVRLRIHICLVLLVASSLQNPAASMTCSTVSKGAFARMIQAAATPGSLADDAGPLIDMLRDYFLAVAQRKAVKKKI